MHKPKLPHTVTLSKAKVYHAGQRDASLRLNMTVLPCHPERSEGSVAPGVEMLHCTQHDSVAVSR